ncbi:MAG: ABC transporter ATP-binding protein [Filifactoraceae bacterium]
MSSLKSKDNKKPVEMGSGRYRSMFLTEKPKDRRGTLNRLMDYLKPYRIRVLSVFILSGLSALLFIIATGMSGNILDSYLAKNDVYGLGKACIFMMALYLGSTMMDYAMNRIMIYVSQRTTATIRSDLFAKVGRLKLSYIEGSSSGDLMSRMTNDIDNISSVLTQYTTQFFFGIFQVSGVLIAMLLLNVYLTAIAMIVVPLMFIITTNIAKVSRRYYKKQQSALGELNGYVEEIISSEKLIKLYNKEEEVKRKFSEINFRLKKAGIIAQALSGLGPIMNMINNSSYLIVSVAGAYMIVKNMGVTVGIMLSFLLYMKQFTRPLNELSSLFNTVQSALAGAERVFEVLNEEEEYEKDKVVSIDNLEGDINLENIHFSYEEGKEVLKGISFKAKKGQQIAIVGQTGAGKTTIISLLNRFYDPDSGTITIDGKNIADYHRDSIRKSIAMVLQDNYLFSETICDNIRYGKVDATREDVIEAAKKARAHGFIMHLLLGYDTVLQDNGQDLSQGQRQLISIARAMLSDPDILILDEATSSIDTATELQISKALKELMKGRTSFIIAHRLSTIKNADIILVMGDGKIIEQGNHQELMEKNGSYAELVNSQYNFEGGEYEIK